MKRVVVTGSFDDLRSRDMRFLHEASKLGTLHLLMWSDDVVRSVEGHAPKFPEEERWYFLKAIRYVSEVTLLSDPDVLRTFAFLDRAQFDVWAMDQPSSSPERRHACEAAGVTYQVITDVERQGFPVPSENAWETPTGAKKVIVTGCYDWLHTGHIRFFEEVSALGDLYVAVGNDASVRELKGEGHPLFPEEERRYMVQSIRTVKQAVLTKGTGWMDAAPNIAEIQPDIYAVNADGDRPEKRAFCAAHGLAYVVLKREPKEGLTQRSSTTLRGF